MNRYPRRELGSDAGYAFRHVARMERIKLSSVRSTWWLGVAAVVSMAAAGAGVGLGYRSHSRSPPPPRS
jgi:hypothetical protein